MNNAIFIKKFKVLLDHIKILGSDGSYYTPKVTNANRDLRNRIRYLQSYYNLPYVIVLLLKCVKGDNDKIIIYNDNGLQVMTFYKINEIEAIHNDYISMNQKRWIDLGMNYSGLGYYHVLSFDKIKKMAFLRLDGGSNDHERIYNRKFFIETDNEDEQTFNLDDQKYQKFMYSINAMLEILNSNDLDNKVIVSP